MRPVQGPVLCGPEQKKIILSHFDPTSSYPRRSGSCQGTQAVKDNCCVDNQYNVAADLPSKIQNIPGKRFQRYF